MPKGVVGRVPCTVAGCPNVVHARGLCSTHRSRLARTGTVEGVTEADRFWTMVAQSSDPTGCWEWTAARAGGYGQFYTGGSSLRAHRFAYEQVVGPIPPQLVLDHLCRNRGCVNPAHLEPVTSVENIRRGDAGRVAGLRGRSKTHCPAGHEYTLANTYCYRGSRQCRTCRAVRASAR